MKTHFVYGVLPAFVTYTDDLPDNVGGRANGLRVRIRPRFKDDLGLHEHEYEHVRQWYRGLLPWLRMTHLEREVAAYKLQLKYYPDDRSADFAERLTRYPDFTITQEEALVRIMRGA